MQDWLNPQYQEGAPRTSQNRGDDRSTARLLSAAVVAGGLAFSASLNPLPGLRSPLDLWQHQHEAVADMPDGISRIIAKQLIGLTNVAIPTLVDLVGALHNRYPAVRPEVFMRILENHSLPEMVRAFESLMAAGTQLAVPPDALTAGGFGGGGGAPARIPLPELTSLLTLLLQHMPAYLAHEIIATLYPASTPSVDTSVVTQPVSPPDQTLVSTATTVVPADPPPAPVAPPPTDPVASAPPAATPTDPTPPVEQTPPAHPNDTAAPEPQIPVSIPVPDVPDPAPVVDQGGTGNDPGTVGDDDPTGVDDGSLSDDHGSGTGNADGTGDVDGSGDGAESVGGHENVGGSGASDDSSGSAGDVSGSDDSGGHDGSAVSSIRTAASSAGVDGGVGRSASQDTAGAGDGNHSGDAGSGGD